MTFSRIPRKIGILLAVLLLVCGTVYLVAGIGINSSCDGLFRWQESAYVLRGMDPFLVASGALSPEADIGALNPDGGNMPWTYLLSNVIYPGFLPYQTALVYAKILFSILLALSIWRVDGYIKRTLTADPLKRALLLGALFASYMWFATLRLGNHAAYLTLLIFLLLTFDHNEHFFLAGILYAFLLMKPQDSGPFLLVFLLKKNYKAILTAAGILLGAMLITSALIRCSPLRMLLNAYELCVSYENLDNYIYYGLLDPLVSVLHVPSAIVLPLGMALGIGATAFVVLRYRNAGQNLIFAAAALFSVCWMYVQPSDCILLGLVAFSAMEFVVLRDASGVDFYLYAGLCLLTALPITGSVYMSSFIPPLLLRLFLIAMLFKMLNAAERANLPAALSKQ